jgi:hypothetical protein
MSQTSSSSESWTVPELGPSLGRLGDPPGVPSDPGPLGLTLEDIRLDLVTRLFDVAGAARSFMATGDRQSAIASLGRVAWLGLWEHAVAAAAQRVADAVNSRVHAAAAESRLPPARLPQFLLSPDDVRAIEARLGSGGAGFVSALDALEHTVPAAAAARRMESAWLALTDAAREEQSRWQGEITRARTWRRPRWPLWVITLVVVLVLGYLGLVLGGYLPVPPPLRGLAELWWSRL